MIREDTFERVSCFDSAIAPVAEVHWPNQRFYNGDFVLSAGSATPSEWL